MENDSNIACLSCSKLLAEYNKKLDNYNPVVEKLYKNGNVPIPNLGWFCSQLCAHRFEEKEEVTFGRLENGKIDYYKGEEEKLRKLERKANILMGIYYVIVGIIFLGPPIWIIYSGGFTLKSLGILIFIYLFYFMLYLSKKNEPTS